MEHRLALFRGTSSLGEWALADDPLEVGSSEQADIRVENPAIPARAYLIEARGGTVWLYDLSRRDVEARVLPLQGGLPLPGDYRLIRLPHAPGLKAALPPQTTRLERAELGVEGWVVSVGRGADARRLTVKAGPVRVGSGPDNDLVLHDPTVSSAHCRFELSGGQLCVRDLGSTNGTYVHGLRVTRAELGAGTRVRVGRTDLHVLARAQKSVEGRGFVAASAAMQHVLLEAGQYARLPWPVLVLGPSGVGKEELAALLHRTGPRAQGPFVALNAGGLPRELVESELFGHERGAFTGAVGQRRGVFEQAHGGTLFLDEIGELPLDLQARLLRVLETWQVRRVGAEGAIHVDVRVICATHRDLPRMVASGTFREDLYFRLARLVLRVPALSGRADDILPLAQHFLAGLVEELGVRGLSAEAEARLLAHDWPGNARELRNVLSAAAALSPSKVLTARDIDQALVRLCGEGMPLLPSGEAVERAVERCGGNVAAAARMLELPRTTLRDALRRNRKSP